ncbi:MAG: hypothetical protein COA94_01385 [Rickettsiales bacterium]|nr:MAG: hypothetical protein COA94_01385 [Rickettsiales bacterium]
MTRTIELSQALSAKLCHDLAGSIGAIDNCLSMICGQDTSIAKQAKVIASEESINLVSHLRLLRAAYGASAEEEEVSVISIMKLLTDFFEDKKTELNLHFEKGLIFLDTQIAKAVMCLIVIAAESGAMRGVLDVHVNNINASEFKIISRSKILKLKEDNAQILEGDLDAPIDVGNCREHYIGRICAQNGYIVSVNQTDELIEYNLKKK